MNTVIAAIDYLRELNVASTLLRMTLVLLCGGLIGMEREHKRRPAGFRTYMLVCLGSALSAMMGQYVWLMTTTRWAATAAKVGLTMDVCRFGAQVINGIGFLGAGTIIVTGRQQVKGLTTAACLWASACMGLAIGAGFYECMVVGFLLIYLSMKVLPVIEDRFLSSARNMNVYVELQDINDLGTITAKLRGMQVEVYDIDVEKTAHVGSSQRPSAVLELRLPTRHVHAHSNLLAELSACPGIHTIEEI